MKQHKCPYGCDLEQGSCEHLEQYLNSSVGPSGQSVAAVLMGDVDRIPMKMRVTVDLDEKQQIELRDQIIDFTTSMHNLALEAEYIEILIDKMFFKKTFREIAQDRHYTSPSVVHRLYSYAMERLKHAGIVKTSRYDDRH